MKVVLLPEPKSFDYREGVLGLTRKPSIGVESGELYPAAKVAREFLRKGTVNISVAGVADTLSLSVDASLRPGGYSLDISPAGISIVGQDALAVGTGVQTLRQIVQQCGTRLPCLFINDWPDFEDRGVYYDVCRGRVPKLERLFELADQLSHYKINQLQLYVEHTFAFRGHPLIGKGASPLSAEDILQLDEYCAARGIELLPSLASFGHLATVLHHKPYRHLAEDWGVGKFAAPKEELPGHLGAKGWTLSPAVPEIYGFLDSLFAEFLPLFRSKRFNICCDETWDLGYGQSYELCQRKGKGVVYLEHIKKVRTLSAKYGKKTLFWGDIIRHYPELIEKIPRDVTVLDWGYSHDWPFDRIKDFKEVGLPFYACPGTSSWVSLFPRLPEAVANIHGFAKAGHAHGALGFLNTDWGDGGHYNFMEYSWHGYLFGAEQGWNVAADMESFTQRFAQRFLGCGDKTLANAIDELGRISHVGGSTYYQSIWRHALFNPADDKIFSLTDPLDLSVADKGEIKSIRARFNAKFAERYLKRTLRVRDTLARYAGKRGIDPCGVLPYWVFAADTLACAAHKVTILGPGGDDTPANRKALKRELRGLMKRFETLWMARNRRSEIRTTLKAYRHVIRSL